MPRIPTRAESQRLRTRTGGRVVSPEAARQAFAGDIAVARGLQNLGASAVQVGERVQAREIQEQKEFENKEKMKQDTANRVQFMKARQSMNEQNQVFVQDADEGSPDGLTAVEDYADSSKALDKIGKDIADPELQARLGLHASNIKLSSQARLSSISDRKAVLSFAADSEEVVNKKAKMIQDNPFAAPRMMAETREDIAGLGELYGKDTEKAINGARNVYANNAMGAFLREGQKNERFLDDGIAILQGKGPKEMVAVAKGLKPSERANFLNQFQRAKEQRKATGVSELNANMRDITALALNGGTPSEEGLRKLRKGINANTSLSKEQKVRAHDTVNSALVTGKAIKQAKSLPSGQWGDLINGTTAALNMVNQETAALDPELAAVTNKEFNADRRIQHKKLLQAHLIQIQNQRRKDPALFVLQNFEDIQELEQKAANGDPAATKEFLTALKAKQDYLQIAERDQRLLSKQKSFQIGNLVNSAKDGDQLAQTMQGLEDQYGDNFSKVFEEATKDNKLDPALFVSTQFQDFNTKARVLDNIANRSAINESAKNVTDFNQTDLDAEINEEMDTFRKALGSTDKTGFKVDVFNGYRDAVETEVKRRIGKTGSVKNLDDTVDDVIKFIMDSNYDTIDGGSSFFLMPKGKGTRPNNKKLAESFVSVYSTAENFETLEKDGDKIDYHIPARLVSRFGAKKARAEYMEALEDNARWVDSDSIDGIQLVYDDPSIGENLPVVDSRGKNIEFTFEDLSYNADAKTLDDATDFTTKAGQLFFTPKNLPSASPELFPGGPVLASGGTPQAGG